MRYTIWVQSRMFWNEGCNYNFHQWLGTFASEVILAQLSLVSKRQDLKHHRYLLAITSHGDGLFPEILMEMLRQWTLGHMGTSSGCLRGSSRISRWLPYHICDPCKVQMVINHYISQLGIHRSRFLWQKSCPARANLLVLSIGNEGMIHNNH